MKTLFTIEQRFSHKSGSQR